MPILEFDSLCRQTKLAEDAEADDDFGRDREVFPGIGCRGGGY
jgi:hypothetical protein